MHLGSAAHVPAQLREALCAVRKMLRRWRRPAHTLRGDHRRLDNRNRTSIRAAHVRAQRTSQVGVYRLHDEINTPRGCSSYSIASR